MRKKIAVIFLIVAVVLVGFIFFIKKSNQPQELVFYGNVDTRVVYLSFKLLGKIDNIFKDEGSKVAKDEIVATLDTQKVKLNIESIKAQLEAQKANLEKLVNGFRKEEIEDAKGAYEEALAKSKMLEDVYKRQKVLNEKNATTTELYLNSKYNYEYALGTLQRAKATYDLRLNGNRIEDIKAANASVQTLEANLKLAEQDLKDSVLTSPVDGIVLARYKEIGSVVSATERVLEVSKQDEYWVKAYVDEQNLGAISQGDEVFIYTDISEKAYNGTIGYISPVAEFTPKNIETIELRADLVYYFRVLVDNPDTKMKQGMPVTIKLKNR
jgi:HlyD family secretion protein